MHQPRWDAAAVCLFAIGFACGVAQIPLGLDAAGFGHSFEISTVAANLAASGEFRDPFGVATGPTAHVAPVYPFILATAIRVLRQPAAVVWCMILLNAALHGLMAAMLVPLSQRLYGRRGPGIAGGILLLLTARLMPQWEVALAGVLLFLAARAILDDRPVPAGLWSGVAILTSPLSLPMLALLAVSKGRRFLAISSILALGLCTPWIARNWIVMGAPYFVRDNFGLELYISNNNKAAPDLIRNTALWTMHPNQNPAEAAVVARMGEAAYNRMRLHDALAWMHSHPRRFLQLTLGRVLCYWLPPVSEGWTSYGFWLITVLGFAGAWMARRYRLSLLLTAAALTWELPFLLIQAVGRYRFPALWIWALLAGYAIDQWLTLGNRRKLTINVLSPPSQAATVRAGG
ncbi:MAG TPA: hypothetical protein VMT86_17120 [Bryobacteraceae bacterium]|nr:hypothetical protein [Bryobacteraceae bacterium]